MSEAQIHSLIYDLLREDPELTTLLGRPAIFEAPPPDREFPLVLIGPVSAAAWNCDTHQGQAVTVTLHCWSSKKGLGQIYALGERIGALLRTTSMPLLAAGCKIILIEELSTRYERDWSARATKATLRFRLLVEHNE